MTRESKLGLLIGGALILLVCILVSDFIATSQDEKAAELAETERRALDTVINMGGEPAIALRTDEQEPTQYVLPNPVYQEDAWQQQTQQQQTNPSDRPVATESGQVGSDTTPNSARIATPNTPRSGRITSLESPLPNLNDLPGMNPTPRARQIQAQQAATQLTTIKVKKGDTLSGLAQKHLGSTKRWQELLAVNPALKGSAKNLRAGMTLILPELPPRLLDTAPPPVQSAQRTSTTAATTTSTASTVGTTNKTTIVKNGETLSDVALRTLGARKYWPKLYQANQKIIGTNPDVVQPGTRLKIPAVR